MTGWIRQGGAVPSGSYQFVTSKSRRTASHPIADIRIWVQNDSMDKSVELFNAEQRRLAASGGFKRHLVETLMSLGITMLVSWALVAGLNMFPRNADHSMKVVYYGPVLAVLGLAATYLLQRPFFRRPPFQLTLWGLIFLAVVLIPAGALDALLRSGS